jgi:hypothetical protein
MTYTSPIPLEMDIDVARIVSSIKSYEMLQ